jgi:DNA-binding transcriptional regulator YhcF (GntR family)
VSIALMTLVWKAALPSGRKMVLLALCDNANDQGECYPSVPMLAEKCSMGERTVQQHITDLETDGIVRRAMRGGRSTVYHINPRKICTPAEK